MREKSDINDLFRTRLEHAEMEVRDGFWEELERDLKSSPVPVAARHPHRMMLYMKRWAVAASVLVLLGAASWLWWMAYPDGAGQESPVLPESLAKVDKPLPQDVNALTADASTHLSGRPATASGNGSSAPTGSDCAEEEPWTKAASEGQPVSVHVSITIRQRQYGTRSQHGAGSYQVAEQHPFQSASADWAADGEESSLHTASVEDCAALLKTRDWALKASLGTSLPKGRYHAPLTAEVAVERRLTKRLSLEAGVQYNRLVESAEQTLHTLGIPVRLNVLLAQGSKVDFYAQVGGMVEKCVAGASGNSFREEPVQGSVLAGVGVRYKLTDRLALFAEPSVSHQFDAESSTRTLRTERPVNVNLLCGLRMSY